jgi:hypothetical protein
MQTSNKVRLECGPEGSPNFCFGLYDVETGESVEFVQSDWDYPGLASLFGWSVAHVQADPRTWHFNRFAITMPAEATTDCSHSGQCDDDVEHWSGEIERPDDCTPESLAAELREYGDWGAEELADDDANWLRIVWIAAGNLREDTCKHSGTDGTVDCEECGATVSEFLASAYDWLCEHDGEEADRG